MIVCLGLMLVGITAQKGVCIPLREPTAPPSVELWSLIDQMIGLDKATGLNIEISQIIASCHKNTSIYKVI